MRCANIAAGVVAAAAVGTYLLYIPLEVRPVDLSGERFLVTGCTVGGLGYETAVELAEMNATVLCSVRSKEKGHAVLKEAAPRLKSTRGTIEYALVDLTSFKSVRAFAKEVLQRMPKIDGVVFNAGLHLAKSAVTEDGLETEVQVNHYSQFLLARLLEKRVIESAPSTYLFVSSGAYQMGALDRGLYAHASRPQGRFGQGRGFDTYSDTKLFNVLTANAFARRFKKLGVKVTSNSNAPGFVATNFQNTSKGEPLMDNVIRHLMPYVARNLKEGSVRNMQLIIDPKYKDRTGFYLDDYIVLPWSTQVTAENEDWLWKESSLVVGESA